MNAPSSASPPGAALPLKPKWVAAAILALVVYLLLRPWLVERFGWDLPGFTDAKPRVTQTTPETPKGSGEKRQQRNRPVEVPIIPEQSETVREENSVTSGVETVPATEEPADDLTQGAPAPSSTPPESSKSKPSEADSPKIAKTTPPKPVQKPTPPASSPTEPKRPAPQPKPGTATSSKPPKEKEAETPKLGVLKQLGRDRFESTAGLVYNQYRIDHVMEHSRDNPDKPSHGVFEVSSQEEVLALVDEAYELAKKRGPPQVITEDQGDRTTYTVNLNRKIGHPGGQNGARNRNRALNKVKIVLEETEVITAYPTN